MRSIVMEGYSPRDLIENLRKAPWISVIGGKNFIGIDLGAFALTDTPDVHCPTKYRITVRQIPTGSQFQVEGFCCQDLLKHIANQSFSVTFDNRRLEDRTFENLRSDEDAFKAIIEEIPLS